MPRFSANLGFLWADLPFFERIERASGAGFQAIEAHWPYDVDPDHVRAACQRLGLTLLGINTPRGDLSRGDNGLAALTGREAEFRSAFEQALDWGVRAGASAIHAMAGIVKPIDQPAATATLVDNLKWASERAEKNNITILLEPLNPRAAPNYYYSTIGRASEIIARTGKNNIKLMFDLHHVGISEGDVLTKLECYMPWIGHVQIAAVPSRAEPDEGEIDFRSIFKALDSLNYSGWVGAEYRPRTTVEAGLGWVERLGVSLK